MTGAFETRENQLSVLVAAIAEKAHEPDTFTLSSIARDIGMNGAIQVPPSPR